MKYANRVRNFIKGMCVYVCVGEREREMILPMQSMARVNDNSLKREKLKKLIRLKKKKRTSSLAEKVG